MGLVLRCRTSRSCLRKPSSCDRPILEEGQDGRQPGLARGRERHRGRGGAGQAHAQPGNRRARLSGSQGGQRAKPGKGSQAEWVLQARTPRPSGRQAPEGSLEEGGAARAEREREQRLAWGQGLCPEPRPSQIPWSTPWRPHCEGSRGLRWGRTVRRRGCQVGGGSGGAGPAPALRGGGGRGWVLNSVPPGEHTGQAALSAPASRAPPEVDRGAPGI